MLNSSMNSTDINSTVTQDATFEKLVWSFRTITILIVCGLITILTILGNGLVLVSIKFRLRARSYSDYFIVSLCLADFFVGLFVMPLMTVHSLYLHWPYHYLLCYLWMSIDFTCSTASFLTLASMALDRYWALTAPYFHLRNRSHSSVLIFIVSSWMIPFAIWPGSIVIGYHYDVRTPSCAHPAPPLIIVLLCAFFYYIPLLFMLACYSRIIVNIKNIEVLIKDTCDTIKLNSSGNDSRSSSMTKKSQFNGSGRHDKSSNGTTTTTPLSSMRSRLSKYFQRSRAKTSVKKVPPLSNGKHSVAQDIVKRRLDSNEYDQNTHTKRRSTTMHERLPDHVVLAKTPSSSSTTATIKGQRRIYNTVMEDHRLKDELIINQDRQQQIVRNYLNTYRLSLPTIRYESCSYYQNSNPTQKIVTKAIIEGHRRTTISVNDHQFENSRANSLTTERSRTNSPSSLECQVNGCIKAANISKHGSSAENSGDDEHRRLNRRSETLRISNQRSSSRYSQRAIAEFMHERHKACLRRNQKASRMLGILLAVFLICWLPFTIYYPTSTFYPDKFPSGVEIVVFWLGYVNSLLNPFLYVYSSRNFRQAIIETLCCHVRLRSRERLRYQWSFRIAKK